MTMIAIEKKMKSQNSLALKQLNTMADDDDEYIINPKTNRRVKRTGVVGRQVLQQRQLDALQDSNDTAPTPIKKKVRRRVQTNIQERPLRIPVINDAGLMSISLVTRQGNWLGLSLAHFVDGMRQVRSALSECHPECVDIIDKTFFHILGAVMILKKHSKSVTLGCLQDIKWTTWTDKSTISNINTLRTIWLQILPRVCLGQDRASLPYWNSRYDDLSVKLWLPKGIGCPDSHSNSLNESWDSEVARSWFAIKTKTKPLNNDLSTMSSASCMSTLVESTEGGEEGVNPIQSEHTNNTQMRRVRLFPPAPVADILMRWIACARINYNKCLYNDRHIQPNCSEYELRTKFVNESIVEREILPVYVVNNGYIANCNVPLCGGFTRNVFRGNKKAKGKMLDKTPNPDISLWMTSVPKDVRHSGVHDYTEAKKTNMANLRVGNIRSFRMTYRKTGNRKYPSINVGSALKTQDSGKYLLMFPKKLASTEAGNNGACQRKGKGRVYASRILVSQNDRDFVHTQSQNGFKECRVQYSCGRWYLLVPYDASSYTRPNKVATYKKEPMGMAAIDPGARTFATVYDGDRVFTVQHDRARMKALQTRLDKLRSLRTKKEIKSRVYLRGRRRVKRKWDNLMADMHWKLASELVQYKVVGLPSFRTENMVQGKLFKGTKRELLGLQHGQFRDRLRHKAIGRTQILTVDESFSTKTCTQCGNIRNMGGLEVYQCRKCNLTIGRDVGSARSIFMCTMLLRLENHV
jgi:transposase